MNNRYHLDTLQAVHSRVWTWLQSIPGIVGLGIGMNGWRVYVESGFDGNHYDSLPRIPQEIAGFPAEIVFKQVSFACYGNDFQATLQPGVEIASKGQEGGTLGCFARVTGTSNTIVLLTNSHVLYGDIHDLGGSGDGNECGQPSVSCCCCCSSHVIGKNRGNGFNAFNQVSVHVTHPKLAAADQNQSGSEIDCAAAVLNASRPYTNESQYYGMITGAPPAGSLGVSAGDAVEKVGSTTGHSKGTICEFAFTTATYTSGGSGAIPSILLPLTVGGGASVQENFSGARGNINQLIVIPDPNPANPSLKTFFVQAGDSGSVVVNSAKQVIGILTRKAPLDKDMVDYLNQFTKNPLPPHAGDLGIVCPIGKVLTSLGIEIVANIKGTVTTAGSVLTAPDEVLQHRERVLAMERKFQGLEREIRGKALGKEVLDRIKEHRPELTRLIEHRRAVKLAWHRCQGPAYAAHCMRSFEDQRYVVPSQIDGVTPLELIKRMARVLKTHGSERLQHDVAHYEPLALDLIAECSSVWHLVDRIRGFDPIASGEKLEVSTHSGVTE